MIVDRLKAAIQAGGGLGTTLTATEYAALQALLADPKNCPTCSSAATAPTRSSSTPRTSIPRWETSRSLVSS
jgi:hypothetical protein